MSELADAAATPNAANIPQTSPRSHGVKSNSGRKPRACHGCKRLKVKCVIGPGDRRCVRCLRKSLDCRFDSFAGGENGSWSTLEEHGRKLDIIRDEIQSLQTRLDTALLQRPCTTGDAVSLVGKLASRSLYSAPSATPQMGPPSHSPFESDVVKDHYGMAMTRENSPDVSNENQQSGASVLVTEPMGSLYKVTRLRNIRSNQANVSRTGPESVGQDEDFIARGIIGVAEAEELYNIFHTSLNQYLWVGIEQIHTSLTSIRRSSQLLAATILTVTALHMPTSAETFDNCYREFLHLISSSMFSRYHSVDDVRAFCIAAFWLSDVSWKLSGHAIRVATELDVHNAFFKALEGDREAFLRARLWYMLYVCDHHFSIAYGRPPMISESLQIREHEQFLKLPFADALDYRILSQVALFQIMTRIHDTFAEIRLPHTQQQQQQQQQQRESGFGQRFNNGSGGASPLSEQHFPHMRRFNLEIDAWRIKWHALQRNNNFIGTFPPNGIILYSYFAKLQLNSFAIRGLSISYSEGLSTERREFIDTAISAAMSILSFVSEESDMRRALVGTPLYVHTMIAFASVFLMNVADMKAKGVPLAARLSLDPDRVWASVEAMVRLLKGLVVSDRHLIGHLAAGLEKMLDKARLVGRSRGSSRGDSSEDVSGHKRQQQQQQQSQGGWASRNLDWASSGQQGTVEDSMETSSGFEDQMMLFMNDSILFDAFGTETMTSEVYNLLSSQFS